MARLVDAFVVGIRSEPRPGFLNGTNNVSEVSFLIVEFAHPVRPVEYQKRYSAGLLLSSKSKRPAKSVPVYSPTPDRPLQKAIRGFGNYVARFRSRAC